MKLIELLPTLHSLPKAEKLQVIQILTAEVAKEESSAIDLPGEPAAVWSPYDSTQGAADLLAFLDANPPVIEKDIVKDIVPVQDFKPVTLN